MLDIGERPLALEPDRTARVARRLDFEALGSVDAVVSLRACRIRQCHAQLELALSERQAFERETGVRLRYRIGPRRPGDVDAIYAENAKAREKLGWQPRRDVSVMMSTAWAWEQKLASQDHAGPDRHQLQGG